MVKIPSHFKQLTSYNSRMKAKVFKLSSFPPEYQLTQVKFSADMLEHDLPCLTLYGYFMVVNPNSSTQIIEFSRALRRITRISRSHKIEYHYITKANHD